MIAQLTRKGNPQKNFSAFVKIGLEAASSRREDAQQEGDMKPKTKLSQLQEAIKSGDRKLALRIASKFPELGAQRGRILKAWNALMRPAFYAELGIDVEAAISDGMAALHERYIN